MTLNLTQRVCVTLCGDWLMSSLTEYLELNSEWVSSVDGVGVCSYPVVDGEVLSTLQVCYLGVTVRCVSGVSL